MSAEPVAKMAPTGYVSVKSEIVRKALVAGMSIDIVNGRAAHFQKMLLKHRPIHSRISLDESLWLLELLIWGSLCTFSLPSRRAFAF